MARNSDDLIKILASTITEETLFNPYNQICKDHDISTAPGLRQGNLRIYLNSYKDTKIEELWVFDAADYYGTKQTGVPFLEPLSYDKAENILGISSGFERSIKNSAGTMVHDSYTQVWDMLSKKNKRALLWNVLPFYPHDAKDISKKRPAGKEEYIKYGDFIHILIEIFKPKVVYAVGENVKKTLQLLNIKAKILTIEIQMNDCAY